MKNPKSLFHPVSSSRSPAGPARWPVHEERAMLILTLFILYIVFSLLCTTAHQSAGLHLI